MSNINEITKYLLSNYPDEVEKIEQDEVKIPNDPSIEEISIFLKESDSKLQEKKKLQETNKKYKEHLRIARENDIYDFSKEMKANFETKIGEAKEILKQEELYLIDQEDPKYIQYILNKNREDIQKATDELLHHYASLK